MTKVDQLRKFYATADCSVQVFDAPKDAQTFDKMLVVFVDEVRDLQKLAGIPVRQQTSGRRIIRRVCLYNSKTDQIVSEY